MATCGSAETPPPEGARPQPRMEGGEAPGQAAGAASTTFGPRPQLTGDSATAKTTCQNATEQAFNPREEMMTHGLKPCLLSIALLCALGPMGHAQNLPSVLPPGAQNNPAQPTPAATARTVQGFVPLTDQMLRSPKPE